MGVKRYTDGSEFKGDLTSDGKREGVGVLVYNKTKEQAARYEGEWKDDMFHGLGTYYYVDGSSYCGEWIKGKRHGDGKLTAKAGDVYRGQWKDHKQEGKGSQISANGDRYEGNWIEGKKAGYGEATFTSGASYKGKWKADKRHGQGEYRFSNGDQYIGGFVNGVQHGDGLYKYINGDIYRGQFKNGLKNGICTIVWANDGAAFSGKCINGIPTVGTYTWPDGRAYGGAFKPDNMNPERIVFQYKFSLQEQFIRKDKFEGRGRWHKPLLLEKKYIPCNGRVHELSQEEKDLIIKLRDDDDIEMDKGILTPSEVEIINHNRDPANKIYAPNGVVRYMNGDIYEGDFKPVENSDFSDNQYVFNGLGKFVKIGHYEYTGEYMDNLKHGKGLYRCSDGSCYEGDFLFNKKDGVGIYTWPDGATYSGQWRRDKMHGDGVMKCLDTSLYQGEWKNDRRHGHGILRFKDGAVYIGEFKKGNMHGKGQLYGAIDKDSLLLQIPSLADARFCVVHPEGPQGSQTSELFYSGQWAGETRAKPKKADQQALIARFRKEMEREKFLGLFVS